MECSINRTILTSCNAGIRLGLANISIYRQYREIRSCNNGIGDIFTSQQYHMCNISLNIAVGHCRIECTTSTMILKPLLTDQAFVMAVIIYTHGTIVG